MLVYIFFIIGFPIFFCFRHQCNHKASAVSDEKQPRHRCGNFLESAAVFVYVHGKKRSLAFGFKVGIASSEKVSR